MQDPQATPDAVGQVVLLMTGVLGIFFLITTLVFLASKLLTKNNASEDQVGMLGDEDEEEYDEYVDIIDNQWAIFTVDDSEINDIKNAVNSFK